MTYGQRIDAIRKERNYTLMQLAIKAHVSVNTINSWVYYGTHPDIDRLIKVADALNISLDELVGRDFPKEEQSDVEN